MDPRKRILVIDDDVSGGELLRDFLGDKGFDVSVALTARDGFNASQASPPDLIVLDLYLPDMKGSELCAHLRARPGTRDTPIILCTAHQISMDEKLKGFGAGADDYLVRPFGLQELMARIEALLRRSRPVPSEAAPNLAPFPKPPPPTEEPAEKALLEKPRLHDLVQRFLSVLVSPTQTFLKINPRTDMLVSVLSVLFTALVSSLTSLSRPDASFDLWIGDFSLALVLNILLWLSTSGLLALVLPFSGTVLPTRIVVCAAGLAWTPRAVGAALSALYGVLAGGLLSGEVQPFSAGIDVIAFTPSTGWIIGLSHIGLFDVWTAYAVLHAFWSFRPTTQKRWDSLAIFVGVICVLFGALTRY